MMNVADTDTAVLTKVVQLIRIYQLKKGWICQKTQ
jgi:hypothetical protein